MAEIRTEADYVDASRDSIAVLVRVVDARSGEAFDNVVEANAVDGWLYQHRIDGDGKLILERYINDDGRIATRPARFRHTGPIAILFGADVAPSFKQGLDRLKPR